jgi:hypothetical protein
MPCMVRVGKLDYTQPADAQPLEISLKVAHHRKSDVRITIHSRSTREAEHRNALPLLSLRRIQGQESPPALALPSTPQGQIMGQSMHHSAPLAKRKERLEWWQAPGR